MFLLDLRAETALSELHCVSAVGEEKNASLT